MNMNQVDFNKFGGPVYSGRDRGQLARKESDMDTLDLTNEPVHVKIASDTYALTSSFFLGLFGPSIKKCGSKEAFLNKFIFDMPEAFNPMLESCVERALRGNTGLLN